jgi:hypothetical protein
MIFIDEGPLASKTRALNWKARLKIALHIAKGNIKLLKTLSSNLYECCLY